MINIKKHNVKNIGFSLIVLGGLCLIAAPFFSVFIDPQSGPLVMRIAGVCFVAAMIVVIAYRLLIWTKIIESDKTKLNTQITSQYRTAEQNEAIKESRRSAHIELGHPNHITPQPTLEIKDGRLLMDGVDFCDVAELDKALKLKTKHE